MGIWEESAYEGSERGSRDRRFFVPDPPKVACSFPLRKDPRLVLRDQLAAQVHGDLALHRPDGPYVHPFVMANTQRLHYRHENSVVGQFEFI